MPSMRVGEQLVAHPALVIRSLFLQLDQLGDDRITPIERIELAIECALRRKLVTLKQLRALCGRGWPSTAFAELLDQRRKEPPTESFAETRAVQLLRRRGYTVYRQLPVLIDGRKDYRIDLVIAFELTERRPRYFSADIGVGIEVDSQQWHDGKFERDRQRQCDYDALGLHWVSITARMIERQRPLVFAAIGGAFRRSGRRSRPAA
jgi:hypothetical protein